MYPPERVWVHSDSLVEIRDGDTILRLSKENGDNFVVLQDTGLKDEYGKDIYEGDILYNREFKSIGVIVWMDDKGYYLAGWGKFFIRSRNVYSFDVDEQNKVKIIGNICENKELWSKIGISKQEDILKILQSGLCNGDYERYFWDD